jgi:regulation of enolase protein 1 (concanavalin A-like superfamily)
VVEWLAFILKVLTTLVFEDGWRQTLQGFKRFCKHSSCHVYALSSEDAFVITCVANLMEVKVLYVQQDLRYEISSY